MTNEDQPSAWSRYLRPTLASLTAYDVPPMEAEARLHANECPEPWPQEVLDALAEVIKGIGLGRYPDTSARSLRKVLGERHGCDPDRVVLGNGSDEIIYFLAIALAGGPGATPAVVLPTPTFVMYAHIAKVIGLEIREVPLDEQLQLDETGMRAALADNAALCFLARPNNPTGTLFDAELVRQLIADHPATVFVIDEAYSAYAPGTSLWTADGPDNQVHMSTLSKVGLASLRVGYGIACPELARELNKVRPPYNISQTSMALAEAVLTRFSHVQNEMVARTIANRDRLAKILAKIPGARSFPSAGNLILVRIGEGASRLHKQLAAQGVLVRDVSTVPGVRGCLRVSVGASEDLDLLERALAVATASDGG
jgi:histidinol-phosphate aminotransferase